MTKLTHENLNSSLTSRFLYFPLLVNYEPTNEDLALKRHLSFHLSNWAEGTANWKKLYQLRQYELTVLRNNVYQLYQEWPILKNHLGHELVKLVNPLKSIKILI
jgi:hypothetical protein